MLKSFHLTAHVSSDREVRVSLPADFPVGDADLTIVARTSPDQSGGTLGDLLDSEFFGMWQDRGDIDDSLAHARELREKAWSRPR